MPPWKGIIGTAFTADEFKDYVAGLQLRDWIPKFVVLHNTQIPTFAAWMRTPGVAALPRIKSLEHYYRDDQKWSGGPHVFVADLIWAFTPLWLPGVHAPSWNGLAWGVEMVGDYDTEELSSIVFDNTIAVLTALHKKIHKPANTLRFHKEDPLTTHKGCPGKNVDKNEIVQLLDGWLDI
jgi:hypothetical protein